MADLLSTAAAMAHVSVDASAVSSLTTAEGVAASILFTGALAADKTFQLPTTSRPQKITNGTTGSYDLFVKRGASGAAYVVPQNETIEVR